MVLPWVPSCLLHTTRRELSLPNIRCELFRKNKYTYSLLLRSCFWLRHMPWILQGFRARVMFPSAPQHLIAPQGSQLSTNKPPSKTPLDACSTQKQVAQGEQQCQSRPGEPRGEHWEAPEWQRGWECEEQEHSALLLDSAKSANPPVATHAIPGKEGGSATRDTPMPQEELEGTCCLPATGSSQGSTFLPSLPHSAIDSYSVQDPSTCAGVRREGGGGDKAGAVSRLAV